MKKISIIIPAYNEEKTIDKVIKSVLSVKIPNYSKEIIIVNDASIDSTQRIIDYYTKKKKIRGIQHKKNLGKGAAIVSASKILTGDIVLIQDADLEYDPQDIPKLVRAYDSHPTCAVYGSRNLKKSNGYSYISYLLGNKFLNFVTNLLYGINITDMETCYKLIPAKIFKKINLTSRGFEIEPEITGKISMLGCNIFEVPISYKPRSIEEGKKIRWTDGILALKKLIGVRIFFK
ncbi:MAG: glycosyltransferase family 2 protein [Candidatus Pacearchaeota archaeon]